jgi:cytochrome c553
MIRLPRIIWLFGALAAGGIVIVVSGIVPIKASSGHWPITEWFLHFAMRRSVATHALGLEAPSLEEPWIVLKGAAHYEIGCRPCHGSPDLPDARIARWMTPQAPYLPSRISDWTPQELFYIVKHGVKFTGMPAWPSAARDDEVWASVAFLLTLPDLDGARYRQLVDGEEAIRRDGAVLERLSGREPVPSPVITSCGRCHGIRGRGRDVGAFPRLAGQRPMYLRLALEAFARGDRHSGIMGPIAAGLDDDAIRAIAAYYGSLDQPEPAPAQPREDIRELGEAIALRGIPAQRVPSCADCHGPTRTVRNPAYPVLAGQYVEYLALQLELFAAERRGGSPYARLMRKVVAGLTPEQMQAVAQYYASLPAASTQ